MNVIFSAFATLQGYREGSNANVGAAAYYRCAVVALCSAKAKNPADTVAMVANSPVPEPFLTQLRQGGVEVWHCPFDQYLFEADTPWALAFYKLCAMEFVVREREFAHALMLDVDTFTQYGYSDLWAEADEAVLLYQVPHAASQPMTAAISAHADRLYPGKTSRCLTHFGGEFIAGSKARLTAFMARCRQVYEDMRARHVTPQEGDEAIWCLAAYQSQLAGAPVRAANAYVFRYWLGGRFYYVSTNYYLDPVCVLHLPGAAKERQFPLLYRYYVKKGRFPELKTVYRWCCLPPARPPLWRTIWVRLLAKFA